MLPPFAFVLMNGTSPERNLVVLPWKGMVSTKSPAMKSGRAVGQLLTIMYCVGGVCLKVMLPLAMVMGSRESNEKYRCILGRLKARDSREIAEKGGRDRE
jgi:hypothetical protein